MSTTPISIVLQHTAWPRGLKPHRQFTVQGWVRTSRFSKRVTFLHLYDGSTDKTLQVVVAPGVSPDTKARLGVGAAVRVTGDLVESKGAEQPVELLIKETQIELVGDSDPSEFPIQKKEASHEFLRTIPHLRVRTEEFQRIFIARNKLAMGIHKFFQERGYMWVHTPIITASDCEGAGEMFRLTTDKIDLSKGDEELHFFGREAFLTVSGQLEVEPFACAFSKVYTFGPTFRAENSQTTRHASEFWMIEPEMAFATLTDVMDMAEEFIGSLFIVLKDLRVIDLPTDAFARITYTEAMEILESSGKSFEFPVGWGHHLQTEHEKYLTEVVFKKPVFVTHYPIEQKPFYMRMADYCADCLGEGHVPVKVPPTTSEQTFYNQCNHCAGSGQDQPGRQTVECFDLLVPGVGEIIGGSAREERLDKLIEQMGRTGISQESYSWYLDLRRYGTVPHGGFGLGFERALMWLLGIENIRDSIPYPRTPGVVT